jgi:hypothetical protein
VYHVSTGEPCTVRSLLEMLEQLKAAAVAARSVAAATARALGVNVDNGPGPPTVPPPAVERVLSLSAPPPPPAQSAAWPALQTIAQLLPGMADLQPELRMQLLQQMAQAQAQAQAQAAAAQTGATGAPGLCAAPSLDPRRHDGLDISDEFLDSLVDAERLAGEGGGRARAMPGGGSGSGGGATVRQGDAHLQRRRQQQLDAAARPPPEEIEARRLELRLCHRNALCSKSDHHPGACRTANNGYAAVLEALAAREAAAAQAEARAESAGQAAARAPRGRDRDTPTCHCGRPCKRHRFVRAGEWFFVCRNLAPADGDSEEDGPVCSFRVQMKADEAGASPPEGGALGGQRPASGAPSAGDDGSGGGAGGGRDPARRARRPSSRLDQRVFAVAQPEAQPGAETSASEGDPSDSGTQPNDADDSETESEAAGAGGAPPARAGAPLQRAPSTQGYALNQPAATATQVAMLHAMLQAAPAPAPAPAPAAGPASAGDEVQSAAGAALAAGRLPIAMVARGAAGAGPRVGMQGSLVSRQPLGPNGCWRSAACDKGPSHRGGCRGGRQARAGSATGRRPPSEAQPGGAQPGGAQPGGAQPEVQPGAPQQAQQAQQGRRGVRAGAAVASAPPSSGARAQASLTVPSLGPLCTPQPKPPSRWAPLAAPPTAAPSRPCPSRARAPPPPRSRPPPPTPSPAPTTTRRRRSRRSTLPPILRPPRRRSPQARWRRRRRSRQWAATRPA